MTETEKYVTLLNKIIVIRNMEKSYFPWNSMMCVFI